MLSTVRDTLNYVRNLRSKVAQIFLKKKTITQDYLLYPEYGILGG